MKWVYICYEDLSIEAAPAVHVRETVRHLKRLGEEVVAFVPSFSGRGTEADRTVYVPALNVRFIGVYLYQLSLFLYLLSHQLKASAHVFYTRDMGVMVAPLLSARLFGCPHVVEVNGFLIEELRSAGVSRMKIALNGRIARANLRAADRLIAVTDGLAERLRSEYAINAHRIDVVENGVDTELFKPEDRPAALSRLGLPQGYRYVVYVGSFYPYHGLEYFVAALPLVVERLPDVRVLLVGDGYSKKEIVEQVEALHLCDVVTFFRAVRHQEVPTYINAADVCLLFSDLEQPEEDTGSTPCAAGHRRYFGPFKLQEYLACERPILANARDASGRYLEAIGAGVAVDIGSPSQIADALTGLLADEHQRKQMGEAGRKAVHTWEESTKRIVEIGRRLVSEMGGCGL